jgi:DNA-binding response OmpR family regulator
MLEDVGFQVESAASGTEARQRFAEFSPDMLLLDISLSDANGMDLLEEFKNQDEQLMVIRPKPPAVWE